MFAEFVYLVDIRYREEVYQRWKWLKGVYPCSTDHVPALARPDWLVEIEVCSNTD